MEKFKHLKRWTMPESYFGEVWPDYFVFLGQHRESDSVTRSNFQVGLDRLGGESETVQVVRERHWAVGWVEWIAIHESDTAALDKAEEMLAKIEGYPVLSDDHWSELEWNEAQDYWASLSLSERVDLCRDHGISIFKARHDWVPENDGSLDDYLRA